MYTRIHRLLRILMLVQSGGGWTAQRLAVACGVDVRTIFRDVREVQGAGIPMKYDRHARGYVVPRDYFLPPIQLSVDEALALTALSPLAGQSGGIPYLAPAERAITKISAALPAGVREDLERAGAEVDYVLAATEDADVAQDVYATVRTSIAGRRVLACEYESADAQVETFELHPYWLFFGVRAWYVAGWHQGRKAFRTLRLSRFLSVVPTHKTFTRKNRNSLDDYLGNAWRMIRGDEDHHVELHFASDIAGVIAETVWHRTQRLEHKRDGTLVFRATVSGLDEIVWWILSMGPSCRVVSPDELVKRVASLASKTAGLYSPASIEPKELGRRQTQA